jgi:hypothetical protein
VLALSPFMKGDSGDVDGDLYGIVDHDSIDLQEGSRTPNRIQIQIGKDSRDINRLHRTILRVPFHSLSSFHSSKSL